MFLPQLISDRDLTHETGLEGVVSSSLGRLEYFDRDLDVRVIYALSKKNNAHPTSAQHL
jgi:hypothetical protein